MAKDVGMTIRDEKWVAQWSEATEVARERVEARRQQSAVAGLQEMEHEEADAPLRIMTVPHRTPKKHKPMSQRTHAAILAACTFIFFLPVWLLPAMAFTVLFLSLATWTLLGPDRIRGMVQGYYTRLRQEDENRAEALRERAAATSTWIGQLLAALPEEWTRGIYLPDFEPEDAPHAKLSEDPFERLHFNGRMPLH